MDIKIMLAGAMVLGGWLWSYIFIRQILFNFLIANRFCPLYLIITFAIGAVVAFVMLLRMVTPRNRAMYETFCNAYYRFIPDDELRTAVYNKKRGPIRARLKAMGITGDFTPDFK